MTAPAAVDGRGQKGGSVGKAVCPADSSQMLLRMHRGVAVDICPSCGGVWLDRGELEQILRPHQAELVATFANR